jgi:hypothetical protein
MAGSITPAGCSNCRDRFVDIDTILGNALVSLAFFGSFV